MFYVELHIKHECIARDYVELGVSFPLFSLCFSPFLMQLPLITPHNSVL